MYIRTEVVSNPLRLEGDDSPMRVATGAVMFLIHYGWRGTVEQRIAPELPRMGF